jgi:predicted MFS family arabinose efflux permease
LEPQSNNPLTATQGNDPAHPLPPEAKEGMPDYMLTDPGAQVAPPTGSTGISLTQYAVLVAAGAFATTFAQQRVLGNLPTTFLLKDYFHMKREEVAVFFFWAVFAWNLKPIAGIFTDAFPLFGTRRRHYMIIGAAAAGVFWILLAFGAKTYATLMLLSVLLNVAMVFASTVMGGLMVEAGQAFGAPGRISSLRQFVQSVSGIGAPLLGGYLAGKSFGWSTTASIASGSLLALAILTAFVLKERPVPKATRAAAEAVNRHDYRMPPVLMIGLAIGIGLCIWLFRNPELKQVAYSLLAIVGTFLLIIGLVFLPTSNPVVMKAQAQLVQILRSRTLWMAVVMLFLVYTVPGLNTALVYRQTDVLKLDKSFIGFLGSLEGILGVIGAVGYGLFCRKLNLRVLLVGSIAVNALFTLMYLYYTKSTAPFVHSAGGFIGVLSELALMDLAVRSTPKGCEALGFALMMSVRNFGIGLADILGSTMMDAYHFSFNSLVWINALTTFAVLLFVPFLPRAIMSRREGEAVGSVQSAKPAAEPAG